ncbi:MAG: glycosyltransferase [Cytophagales bacterium]|nr:glycosyltransferase [Bernardetiaceae bacterium]MDW8210808.1 glycosyltransferase [Cytophagales bacterium]
MQRPHHVIVTTFWSYKDALIQNCTLPYLKIMHQYLPVGSKIFLLTTEKPHFSIDKQERSVIRHYLSQWNIVHRSFPYYPYGWRSFLNWMRIVFRLLLDAWLYRVKYIHTFCPPAGISAYLLSVLSGATLVLDCYEPHAEASVENQDWQRNSFRFRLLFWLEKLQSRRARYVLSNTAGMKEYARQKYGVEFPHFCVRPNCTNLEQFSEKNIKKPELLAKYGFENKIVAVYAGKFGGIYLKKEFFDLLKVAHQYWGEQFRVLILTPHPKQEVEQMAAESALDSRIITSLFAPPQLVPDLMGLGDFGITPVKPVPTKRYCSPVKDGEYWALGLPVIIPQGIGEDAEIIARYHIGAVLAELSPAAYKQAIAQIDRLLQGDRAALRKKIRQIAYQYRGFHIAEKAYAQVYQQHPSNDNLP